VVKSCLNINCDIKDGEVFFCETHEGIKFSIQLYLKSSIFPPFLILELFQSLTNTTLKMLSTVMLGTMPKSKFHMEFKYVLREECLWGVTSWLVLEINFCLIFSVKHSKTNHLNSTISKLPTIF